MEQEKKGFVTTTYQFRLYRKHLEWFQETELLYNNVIKHYYMILLEKTELLELSNHFLLRELEILTVGTKEMKQKQENISYPLEGFPKIPLYFRRAAINTAIGLARSYVSQRRNWENGSSRKPAPASKFQSSPVYYKGMYKEFTENSICLKLYTGEKWEWRNYHFIGRKPPKNSLLQSPSLVLEKKDVVLHVPVIEEVQDIRTVKERIEQECKICAVSFPNQDCMAVCVILKNDTTLQSRLFIKGGKELKEKKRHWIEKLKKSRKSRGKVSAQTAENETILKKIEQINNFYAHRVSRQIVSYCEENQVALIVVPNYENTLDFREKRYLKTDEYEWQGRKIIRYLKYKAFQKGIVVSSIRPYHITDSCSECGEKIKKYNEGHKAAKKYYGGQLFICPNGHKGNSAENAAKNIGRYFLERYQ